MTDQEEGTGETDSEDEKSFRERVEDIRQERSQEGGREAEASGPPGGEGASPGGNPFQQMMSGVMGGTGAKQGMPSEGNEKLVNEIRKHREEVQGVRKELERIADALEN